MKFYLRVINPLICIIVFLFCLYASIKGENKVHWLAPFTDGAFSSYFFAKGFFCSSALFLLGKILEHMMSGGRIVNKKEGQ